MKSKWEQVHRIDTCLAKGKWNCWKKVSITSCQHFFFYLLVPTTRLLPTENDRDEDWPQDLCQRLIFPLSISKFDYISKWAINSYTKKCSNNSTASNETHALGLIPIVQISHTFWYDDSLQSSTTVFIVCIFRPKKLLKKELSNIIKVVLKFVGPKENSTPCCDWKKWWPNLFPSVADYQNHLHFQNKKKKLNEIELSEAYTHIIWIANCSLMKCK